MRMNGLGSDSRDTGQSRAPTPPARMMGRIIVVDGPLSHAATLVAYFLATPNRPAHAAMHSNAISPSIFRSYDIRGIAGESLTAEIVHDIGHAIASDAKILGERNVVV